MGTTYSALFSNIQEWAWDESVELSGQIPTVIQLGELRLRRDLPVIAFDATRTGTFSGNPVLSLPDRWTADRYFTVYVSGATSGPLERKTLTYVGEYWTSSTTTGTARYYAQRGSSTLIVAPCPVSGATYEHGYREQLADLSSTNQTNWLTSNAQDALLQACLVEAARFKQDQGLLERSEAAYQISVAGISKEALGALSDDFGGQVTPRARE